MHKHFATSATYYSTVSMSFQNSLQHSTQQFGCSLSQCHPFCHQSPIYYPPLRPLCCRWLLLTTYLSPNPLALIGKALPYLGSLVTIAAPTRSTRSSRYISLVTPKPIPPLAAFPYSSLLPMTGTNCKNH